MALNWFKKKAPAPRTHQMAESEGRECYRRGQSPTHQLVAVVYTADDQFEGEFLDVSVGGAAVRFTLATDPGIRIGDVVDLRIQSTARDEFVRTPARAVYVEPGGEQHWRYGFEFVSVGDLYSQLDKFYARFFNRRSSPRPIVPAEQRITVTVLWGNNELKCKAHDLSESGLCISVPEEQATRLEGLERTRLRFRIPGITEELYGPSWIRHRSQAIGRVLLGFEFDFERGEVLAENREALRQFVLARQAELARWEAALGAA